MKKFKLFFVAIFTIFNYSFSQQDSLDIKIGQMLMLGIGDVTSVQENDRILKSIKDQKLGGILLYEKNINKQNSKKYLKKLVSDYQKAAKIRLLVSIDEEGGLVNRLKQKYGFPKTLSAKYLGDVNSIDTTKFYSDIIAHNLLLHGINVNYAPVLDVHNATNPPIGKTKRSFSSDASIITNHARQVVSSHRYFNVKTVLKHFPGHGNSKSDSHFDVADVSKYWQEEELDPYINLIKSNDVDAIMTAHIVNENLDATKVPATLSKPVITDLLRNKLGYNGVIFSDDMQMKAISAHFGFEKSIKLAINAGVDILMFSNHIPLKDRSFVAAEDIIDIVKKAIDNGEISKERIDESYKRIIKFKQGL